MSFDLVGLGTILKVIYSHKKDRDRFIREDVSKQIKKEQGLKTSSGGDFYVPFWADAKGHVSGALDLDVATRGRVAVNRKHKGRLYPILAKSFLLWWNEKRRLRNVPIRVIDERLTAKYVVEDNGTIKIENTLSLIVGDEGRRLIYPYFCENPSLSEEAARIALCLMSASINSYEPSEMRVLDVIAGKSFSILDLPLEGNEKDLFHTQYGALMADWKKEKAKQEE
ncbi:hypothetical protein [Methylobacterium sp. Leaf89]|uniref:hypothetical protein n=1 Tax=Methylobacterium sp. Leaf89 TaxID=1736245 RepID=UPI000AC5278E|nr:hypothetical protein [Methylobacterium sp. Leaf89]